MEDMFINPSLSTSVPWNFLPTAAFQQLVNKFESMSFKFQKKKKNKKIVYELKITFIFNIHQVYTFFFVFCYSLKPANLAAHAWHSFYLYFCMPPLYPLWRICHTKNGTTNWKWSSGGRGNSMNQSKQITPTRVATTQIISYAVT